MNRRRVLFVDDEPHILEGLENMLHKERRRWEMVFATGGSAALAELAKGRFDVIVSDMRMPEMDGAELLSRVKEDYPATARIVLSGQAQRDAIVRALPVVHQFLTKPCDATSLRAVVERACQLQDLLQHDRLRNIVGKLDKLPSVPRTYFELTQAIGDPNAGIAEMTAIVEKDPAMAIKVLQLANSAYFGSAKQLTSIGQAVAFLGSDLLKSLALTAHIFATVDSSAAGESWLERMQRTALLAARLARLFAKGDAWVEDAFTAALVHDIGLIVIATSLPDEFRSITAEMATSERPQTAIERETIGATHAEIGAYLLGIWGIPFPVVEAVLFHHEPDWIFGDACAAVAVVQVADAIAESAIAGRGGAPLGGDFDPTALERAGLSGRVLEWQEIATRELERLGEYR